MDLSGLKKICLNNHMICMNTNHCFICDPVICRMCKHLIIDNDSMIDRLGGCYHYKECYDKFLQGHKPKKEKTKVSIKKCTINNCCN